jgi:RNA polymerase sigma factor (sigma-70 family)
MQETTQPIQVWNNHLVKVSVSRDRSSFQALFAHFAPLLKNYFLAKFPSQQSQQLIEELIQEVMIKVWNKADTYKPEKAAASTWIFTLARNTHIDMIRRQKKHENTYSIETEDIWEDFTENGPYASLSQARETSTISKLLDELPIEQSNIVRKVYMESKTHQEVALELKLPLGTVKSRIRLAHKKLKSLLIKS